MPDLHRITLADLKHLTKHAEAACKSTGAMNEPYVQARIVDNRLEVQSSGGHVLGVWALAAAAEPDVHEKISLNPDDRNLVLRCETIDIKNSVNAMPKATKNDPRAVEISYHDHKLTFRHEFDPTHATESEFTIDREGEIIRNMERPKLTVSSLILQAIFKTFEDESETLIEAVDFTHAIRISELVRDDTLNKPKQVYYVMQMRT